MVTALAAIGELLVVVSADRADVAVGRVGIGIDGKGKSVQADDVGILVIILIKSRFLFKANAPAFSLIGAKLERGVETKIVIGLFPWRFGGGVGARER